jgi:hypothetical protein
MRACGVRVRRCSSRPPRLPQPPALVCASCGARSAAPSAAPLPHKFRNLPLYPARARPPAPRPAPHEPSRRGRPRAAALALAPATAAACCSAAVLRRPARLPAARAHAGAPGPSRHVQAPRGQAEAPSLPPPLRRLRAFAPRAGRSGAGGTLVRSGLPARLSPARLVRARAAAAMRGGPRAWRKQRALALANYSWLRRCRARGSTRGGRRPPPSRAAAAVVERAAALVALQGSKAARARRPGAAAKRRRCCRYCQVRAGCAEPWRRPRSSQAPASARSGCRARRSRGRKMALPRRERVRDDGDDRPAPLPAPVGDVVAAATWPALPACTRTRATGTPVLLAACVRGLGDESTTSGEVRFLHSLAICHHRARGVAAASSGPLLCSAAFDGARELGGA